MGYNPSKGDKPSYWTGDDGKLVGRHHLMHDNTIYQEVKKQEAAVEAARREELKTQKAKPRFPWGR